MPGFETRPPHCHVLHVESISAPHVQLLQLLVPRTARPGPGAPKSTHAPRAVSEPSLWSQQPTGRLRELHPMRNQSKQSPGHANHFQIKILEEKNDVNRAEQDDSH